MPGGKVKTITLHLSAKARALLAKSHVLRIRVTIAAHDSAGASHVTQAIVTLRAPAPTHRRRRHHPVSPRRPPLDGVLASVRINSGSMPSDDTAQVKQLEPIAPEREATAPEDALATPGPDPERPDMEVAEDGEDEPVVAELDPETRARRDAALAHVRKLGDPVLRATALPVERFDQALAEEVEEMGG